jgi:hypothetical protein
MAKPLVIRPDAEKEATEARLWYEERSMMAARNFVIGVRHAFEVIQSRLVVQRHALHRDKLGGGVHQEKVRKSN